MSVCYYDDGFLKPLTWSLDFNSWFYWILCIIQCQNNYSSLLFLYFAMKPQEIKQIRIPVVRISTKSTRHIEYAVQVQGSVRSWTVWHRYSDFVSLHQSLVELFPKTHPPARLPPKTLGPWLTKLNPFKSNATANAEGTKEQTLEPLAAVKLGDDVENRRQGLEQYLRAIYSHESGRWRGTDVWREFLAPPGNTLVNWAGGKANAFDDSGNPRRADAFVTAQSWLEDYRCADQLTRDIRELLWRRESALSRNEVSTSHQCTLQAKRHLGNLDASIGELETGLKVLMGGTSSSSLDSRLTSTTTALSRGEFMRRQDKLRTISEERARLNKLVSGDSRESGGSRLSQYSEVTANNANKMELLQNDRAQPASNYSTRRSANGSRVIASADFGSTNHATTTNNNNRSPTSMQSRTSVTSHSDELSDTKPSARGGWQSKRIFGNSSHTPPPQETETTRTMNNQEILQMQTSMMASQDQHVTSLCQTVRRQREIGLNIGQELEIHNQLLDDLSQDIDRTGNKLNTAKRQINRIK